MIAYNAWLMAESVMSMTARRFGSGSGRPGEKTPHPSAQGRDPLHPRKGQEESFRRCERSGERQVAKKKGILKIRNKAGMSFRISSGFGTNPFLRASYVRFEASQLEHRAKGSGSGKQPLTRPALRDTLFARERTRTSVLGRKSQKCAKSGHFGGTKPRSCALSTI